MLKNKKDYKEYLKLDYKASRIREVSYNKKIM